MAASRLAGNQCLRTARLVALPPHTHTQTAPGCGHPSLPEKPPGSWEAEGSLSLGHSGRRGVVSGHTLNRQTLREWKTAPSILRACAMLCWEAPIAIPGGTRAPGWDNRGRDTRAPVGSEVTTGCPFPGWAGLLGETRRGVPWMPAVWWTPLGVPSSSAPGGPRPGRRLLDSPALAATPPPPPPLGKPGRLLAPRLAFFQAHRAEGAAGLSGWQAFLEQQCHQAECFSARRPHPAPGGAGAGLAAQARWLGGLHRASRQPTSSGLCPEAIRAVKVAQLGPRWAPEVPGSPGG